jgi:purine-binding chemotaxis protein CheW
MEQYLSFQLDQEVFIIEISHVREVLDYTPITPVPRTPEVLVGVINLRGSIIPIIHLKKALNISTDYVLEKSCFVISEVEYNSESLVVALLADEVKEVLEFDNSEILPLPSVGVKLNTNYLKGMKKVHDGFALILNINDVLDSLELKAASLLAQNQSITPD